MKKQRQLSIQWKVFLYLIGFCFLLLTILWLFQTVFLDSFYKRVKLADIRAEAEVIAGRIAEGDWDGLVDAVTARGDLYVEVWNDRRGTILYTGNYIEAIQSKLTGSYKLALLEAAKASGEATIQRFVDANATEQGQESMLYAACLDAGGGELLMVSANISPVGATVDTLRIQLVYISAVMLILAVGLAYLITRRVAGPIARLSDAARRMGGGETDIVFRGEGGSYREIAELADTLEHAREELARTDRLRQELIANVSHDLRTPLTLITGYGEMIRDLPEENTPENMQVIIDESKRLTSLVTDLLDLSRLQSGTGKLEFTRFNLTEDTKAIIGRFAKLSEQEGFTILFERDEDAFVTADEKRIAQVTYNFLINAITHTGGDKRVTVRQIVENGRVMIRVEDSGEGIPAELLPNIWNRYYKADEAHKRARQGSGLGLSIVRSILDQHPGVEYGVESTVGKGSAFWFSLVESPTALPPINTPPGRHGSLLP